MQDTSSGASRPFGPPLQVGITGPADRQDLRTPYVVTVACEHGVSHVPIRRTCRNGCHQQGYDRARRCSRISPPPEALEALAVLLHARRLRCGCDDEYWMTLGPLHDPPRTDGAWPYGIQVLDLMIDNEAYELLAEAGPARSPWGPVC